MYINSNIKAHIYTQNTPADIIIISYTEREKQQAVTGAQCTQVKHIQHSIVLLIEYMYVTPPINQRKKHATHLVNGRLGATSLRIM